VDAYRLGGADEIDDIDLVMTLADSLTVVEWGEGVAEGLADTRLEVALSRGQGADGATAPAGEALGPVADTDPRTVRITPVGQRWAGADLATALSPPAG
jgi:tRNA threonylcarbamoyladenosine biosynthesis protein TsaE